MLKFRTFILALIFLTRVSAQTWVAIPDSSFVSYLQALVPTAMNGNQLDISNPLVTTTTHSINVASSGITDLTGVQYFSSLTYLNCRINALGNLPPLPTTLNYLDCTDCSLTALPALPASLVNLDCYSNLLTSLPSLPDSLRYLGCNNNSLSVLPALPPLLQNLYCSYNTLISLPSLPSTLLNLECNNNSLTSLPVLPSALQTLYCGFNNISCFPYFPTSLTFLSIHTNPFDCLPNYIAVMYSDTLSYPLCSAGNANGCPVSSVAVQEEEVNSFALIYPNPNQGKFYVKTSSAKWKTVEIYDFNGSLISEKMSTDDEFYDLSALPDGIYAMSFKNEYCVVNKKIIIVH